MADTSTEVSKSNPTIKAILVATVGGAWKGRRVVVREVSSDWWHASHHDDNTKAWYLNLATIAAGKTPHAQRALKAAYGEPAVRLNAPEGGDTLVIHQKFQGHDMGVEIVIPSEYSRFTRGAIDSASLAVATDALLEKNKPAAVAALAGNGALAGLAMAIAEAHAKSLSKGQAAGDLTAASVSTSTKAVATRARKSAAQLDREIAAIVGRR